MHCTLTMVFNYIERKIVKINGIIVQIMVLENNSKIWILPLIVYAKIFKEHICISYEP